VENNLRITSSWPWKSDQQIKRDIERQFYWSPFVDVSDITISVEKGEVTLKGTVDTMYEFQKAKKTPMKAEQKPLSTIWKSRNLFHQSISSESPRMPALIHSGGEGT